ncbi:Microfibril-associated glycoprotein 3 [Galemys pyrenaicus]|uniref:Microfibril-associated glycoprotein 3 n=1 Tax=Galemys pyrenaicus TaxID=202257 RepID=A0A8J5ZTA8_GALPY|nr:Microfibril-associated glycoprotein 3 [Galemys pyrenaicus]
MRPQWGLLPLLLSVAVPAAHALEDAAFGQEAPRAAGHGPSNASGPLRLELSVGPPSGDVVIAREGESVALECLLQADHNEGVRWYDSRGRPLDGRGNAGR